MTSVAALARLVDTALDRSVALGFTNLGLLTRSHLPGWPADPDPGSLRGKDAAVTGATSGLGLASATDLARLGARVHLVVRSPDRAAGVVAAIQREVRDAVVLVHRCDVSDLDDVRRFASAFLDEHDRLDVLVHNAGQMPPERTESAQGHEMTMACHVLGPVLMTELLRPALAADGPRHGARLIFVTSGGMYAQPLRAEDPEYLTGDYSPTTAYARSKRAQVELLPVLSDRWRPEGLSVWATHPGWADTPGLVDSLPAFRRLIGPFLRDAAGGADTTVWLAATDPAPSSAGSGDGPHSGVWHDRRERPAHFAPTTRSRPGDVDRIWHWVLEQIGESR